MALLILFAASAPAGFVSARTHVRYTLVLAAEKSAHLFQNTHFLFRLPYDPFFPGHAHHLTRLTGAG